MENINEWYQNWMKSKNKSGSVVATINTLDMLSDFSAQYIPLFDFLEIPELIRNNPGFVVGKKPTDVDMQWVHKKYKQNLYGKYSDEMLALKADEFFADGDPKQGLFIQFVKDAMQSANAAGVWVNASKQPAKHELYFTNVKTESGSIFKSLTLFIPGEGWQIANVDAEVHEWLDESASPQPITQGGIEVLADEYATERYPKLSKEEYYAQYDDVDEVWEDWVSERNVLRFLLKNAVLFGYSTAFNYKK